MAKNQNTEPKAAAPEKKPVRKPEAVIYVGPTIKGLAGGTVFACGLTPVAEKLKAAYPITALLFVPISRLAETRLEIKQRGSAANLAYVAALKAKA